MTIDEFSLMAPEERRSVFHGHIQFHAQLPDRALKRCNATLIISDDGCLEIQKAWRERAIGSDVDLPRFCVYH